MGLLSKLSILIVTYKGDDLLYNCLSSLQNACEEMPEIVVVDNSANDATKKLVEAYPTAKYVASETNLGFAGGNNLGLPHCTKPYVLLLNNDTIIHKEPFTQLIDYLENNPRVAVVQGKMRLVNQGEVLDSCGGLLTPIGEMAFLFNNAPISSQVKTQAVFAVKGACLLFKREVIDKVGGFLFYDHFKSYYEDVDFCHRVWVAGFEVHFVDTPIIDHLQGATAKKFSNAEINAQCLANADFSLAVSLGFFGRIFIAVPRKIFRVVLLICAKIKGHQELLDTFKKAKEINSLRSEAIIQSRKLVQNFRGVSDYSILKAVMRFPPLSYYFAIMRGNSIKINKIFWR